MRPNDAPTRDMQPIGVADLLSAELRPDEPYQPAIFSAPPLALYATRLSRAFAGPRFLGDDIERICGFPAAAFQSEGFWASHIHPADRERVMAEVAALSDGAFAAEYRWLCADGIFRLFLDRAVVDRGAAGNSDRVFGAWLDLTRDAIGSENGRDEMIEAAGRMAGGIAHDLNNMLAAVVGSLDLLMSSMKGNEVAVKRVERALHGALRCAEVTQRLLSWAKSPGPDGFGGLAERPAATAEAGEPVASVDNLARPRSKSGENVLVVEDDAPVRHVAATTLRELGYHVLEAASGESALDVLAWGPPVDLLFTDIALQGGMNGHRLAREAGKLRPGIKVLYTSGYTDRIEGDDAERSPPPFLRKPYRDYELASTLRQILDAGAP